MKTLISGFEKYYQFSDKTHIKSDKIDEMSDAILLLIKLNLPKEFFRISILEIILSDLKRKIDLMPLDISREEIIRMMSDPEKTDQTSTDLSEKLQELISDARLKI